MARVNVVEVDTFIMELYVPNVQVLTAFTVPPYAAVMARVLPHTALIQQMEI
jgi:hypothetical protein